VHVDCKRHLSKSLFVVGEFGGNDYNAALFSGRTMADVRGYVPQVVSHIVRGLETMIRLGAMDVVVPGVLPIGCFPIYLTLYGTSNGADYDGDGCLKSYNDLSSHHNSLLRRSLANLQRTYPHTRIMYADFYSQVIHMIRAPQNFGKPIYLLLYYDHYSLVFFFSILPNVKSIRVKVVSRAVQSSKARTSSLLR
jgi:hypothetical protein